MDLDAAFARALPHLARSASPADGVAYARDLWPRHHIGVSAGDVAPHAPGLVVWPRDTAEVASVVRLCAAEGVPLVPYGAGSGVCGGILPDRRTVVLDLKRLDRWRELDEGAPTLEVEAGVLGIRLEEDLERRGFTTGHYPSSILCSTVGGWIAARGAGQCSGLYGKIEDMVASAECVTGSGEIVRFHRRAHGPSIVPLLVGSEGILGVITSARLRLHRTPAARTFGAYSFPTVQAGWTAMRDMFQAGLRPAVARLYDPFDSFIARMGSVARDARGKPRPKHGPHAPGAGGLAMRAVLRAPELLNEAVEALGSRVFRGSTLVLIFETAAADDGAADMARADAIAKQHGASSLGEGPARHWIEHRYGVSFRQSPVFMSGAFGDTMEVAATWARLPALYDAVREALGKHVFVMAHLSHAYPDGCSIYFTFAGAARDAAETQATYDAAWRDALDAAIGAGGVLSHHHGVGRSKASRLGVELGAGVSVIGALARVLDPAGIMNPGNLLPEAAPVRRAITPPPASPQIDRTSQLVRVRGEATLAEIERALGAEGLSLALGPHHDRAMSLAAWIATGAPGAPDPWLDPVDHLVAGFTAKLASGTEIEVRPAPRRAVGPDLLALFHGAGGRAGVITSAWLRAHGAARARPLPVALDRDPPLADPERGVVDRVLAAAAAVR